jgi:hypothetical protein
MADLGAAASRRRTAHPPRHGAHVLSAGGGGTPLLRVDLRGGRENQAGFPCAVATGRGIIAPQASIAI